MNRMAFLPALLTGAVLILGAAPATCAEPGSLDGKRFDGVFIERGKTKGEADVLSFKDGRFRSTACDRYGYSDAPYQSRSEGDAIAFEAQTESAQYGRLVWKGVIRNGKLDATATMLRPGKPAVENWVVAGSRS